MADVSVIIPCYNGESFIAQTLESVLGQTDVPREVIVIDDGSTDDSAAIIEKFAQAPDSPVTLIKQQNAGESTARNVGIEKAVGTFIAFLDADDLWMPDKTVKQLELLAGNPQAIGTFSSVFNFENDLDDHGRAQTERTKADPSVEDLMVYHYVTPSTLMVRRAPMRAANVLFDVKVHRSEDMLFAADLRLAGPLVLLDEATVAKRIHAGQQSKDPWHALGSLESRTNWVRQRRDVLGDDRADTLDGRLGKRMIDLLEDRYWRRQLDGFAEARATVQRLYPEFCEKSDVANRRLYPKWFYKIIDAIGGKK